MLLPTGWDWGRRSLGRRRGNLGDDQGHQSLVLLRLEGITGGKRTGHRFLNLNIPDEGLGLHIETQVNHHSPIEGLEAGKGIRIYPFLVNKQFV